MFRFFLFLLNNLKVCLQAQHSLASRWASHVLSSQKYYSTFCNCMFISFLWYG